MTEFTNHIVDSAPEAARAILKASKDKLGFVPNLYAKLAESPAALAAYMSLGEHFGKSSLNATQQQVVLLSASVVNGCEFCVAAHSVVAKNMVKVDAAIVDAIRDGEKLPDAKLDTLARFTRDVVRERGWVTGAPLEQFLATGFSRAQALDVVLGVAMKTLSNYANHLTGTETNEQFASEAWTRA